MIKGQSVEQCGALCDREPACKAFEYGVYNRDCRLQDSSNNEGCNGYVHNLDLYKPKPGCHNNDYDNVTYTIVTSRSEMKEFVAEPLPFNAVTKVTIEVTTSKILVYFNDTLRLNFKYKTVNCYALLKDYVANLNAYANNSIIKSLIIEPATNCQNRDECNMGQRFNFKNKMYVRMEIFHHMYQMSSVQINMDVDQPMTNSNVVQLNVIHYLLISW